MATVFITGANRGIGLEFVRQFTSRGDKVIAACRNPDGAEELKNLSAENSNLSLLQLDVSDLESMQESLSQLGSEPIDILVNNAGVYGSKSVEFGNVESEEWLWVLKVNTVAPLILTQLLIDNLRSGQDKKLIYITSKMGSIDDNQGGGSYVYRSSKTALNQVMKSVSIDLGNEGFVSAVLHPGWVQTDMGGPNALIDTLTSVTGMVSVIDGLDAAGSGGFYNYDGSAIAW